MIKLYKDALHPRNLVAYVEGSGWLAFPAKENGWEERQPARGLDPLYLRQVSVEQGVKAGVPQREYREAA